MKKNELNVCVCVYQILSNVEGSLKSNVNHRIGIQWGDVNTGNGFDFASKFWQKFTPLICDLMRLQVLMCHYKMHYLFFIVINAYIYTNNNPKQNKEFR